MDCRLYFTRYTNGTKDSVVIEIESVSTSEVLETYYVPLDLFLQITRDLNDSDYDGTICLEKKYGLVSS